MLTRIVALLLAFFPLHHPVAGAEALAEPAQYFLDTTRSLTAEQIQALSAVLIEQDHVASQQLIAVVFSEVESGKTPSDQTRELFKSWSVSSKGGGNAGVLSLFLKEQKASLVVGYGLGARIEQINEVEAISKLLLNEGKVYEAVSLTILELLRQLESPLIESGRAREILLAQALQTQTAQSRQKKTPASGLPWIFVGALIFLAGVPVILSAEAHFTADGWFRPQPWTFLKAFFQKTSGTKSLGGTHGSW